MKPGLGRVVLWCPAITPILESCPPTLKIVGERRRKRREEKGGGRKTKELREERKRVHLVLATIKLLIVIAPWVSVALCVRTSAFPSLREFLAFRGRLPLYDLVEAFIMSKNKAEATDTDSTTAIKYDIRPFEWLTSAESLHSKLQQALLQQPPQSGNNNNNNGTTTCGMKRKVRVLHVGCGSSVLGEYLVQHFSSNDDDDVIAQVINVDRDQAILDAMQARWQHTCQVQQYDKAMASKMKFVCADIVGQQQQQQQGQQEEPCIPLPDGSIDLVVDKSTLDCLLCSDQGAAALLTECWRLLNPLNGVYLCISFHHIDLLRPLLADCPGTQWNVEHSVMYRHVESLVGDVGITTNLADVVPPPRSTTTGSGGQQQQPPNHKNEEDAAYHRTVNVLLARKQGGGEGQLLRRRLDRQAVHEHVNRCSDAWYQQQNPMLTPERTRQIRLAFESATTTTTTLALPESYQVLFTPQEREHLTYDAFLEDWVTFLQGNPNLEPDTMSSETALSFLAEMQ